MLKEIRESRGMSQQDLADKSGINKRMIQACEWIKYDYRTMCPKNHGDVDNPYWRIPTNMKHLLYCPYCGERIRLNE